MTPIKKRYALVALVFLGLAGKMAFDPEITVKIEAEGVNAGFAQRLPMPINGPGMTGRIDNVEIEFLDTGETKIAAAGNIAGYTIDGPVRFESRGVLALRDGGIWYDQPQITKITFGDILNKSKANSSVELFAGIAKEGMAYQLGLRPVVGLAHRGPWMRAASDSITDISVRDGALAIEVHTVKFVTSYLVSARYWAAGTLALILIAALGIRRIKKHRVTVKKDI